MNFNTSFGLNTSYSPKFWTGCAVLYLAVTWFIPNHYAPLYEIFNDVWIALFVVGLWVWVTATHKISSVIAIPFAAVFLFGMALIPLAQWLAGLIPYSGQAVLTTSYLLASALVLTLGFAIQRPYRDASIAVLLAAILLAALANAIVVFIQKTGLFPYDDISFPGVLVFQIATTRPTGNLGQANQMATLFVWGLLSSWWFLHTKQIRTVYFFTSSAVLTMAIVCTQSRTAYLNLLIVALMGALAYTYSYFKRGRAAVDSQEKTNLSTTVFVPIFWLLMLLTSYSALYVLERWLGLDTELRQLITDPVRSVIYPRFLHAAFDQFWFGYGWSHLTKVQMDMPLDGIELGVYFLHSHSVFLDLLLWLGVPLGMSTIALMLWGLFWLFKRTSTVEHFILIAVLVVLLGHASVEYPHMYGYFLLPAAWIVGALAAQLGAGDIWHSYVRRNYLHAVSVTLVSILVACVWDNENISRELMFIRLKSAKIYTTETVQIDSAIVLNQFEDRLRFHYMPPVVGTSETTLNWMRRAVLGYPVPATNYNLIGHLALNGHPDEAQVWMKRCNNIATQETAHEFVKQWNTLRKKYPDKELPAWPVTGVLLYEKPSTSPLSP
jgi:Virulence factor membrane-bound polymerase, C-terminal/Protein glycosylation ligase/O-Antigen ligase